MPAQTALRNWDNYPLTDSLIAFEKGLLSYVKTTKLFQCLVDTGMAWTLQGFYGRIARDLIEGGYVSADRSKPPEIELSDDEEAPCCERCGEPVEGSEGIYLIDDDARDSYNRSSAPYRGAVDWPTIFVHESCCRVGEAERYAL